MHFHFQPNKCYDFGGYAWLLSQPFVRLGKYRIFAFLDLSVRGPFAAAYFGRRHWTHAFTGMLSDSVKLAGPTINCAGTHLFDQRGRAGDQGERCPPFHAPSSRPLPFRPGSTAERPRFLPLSKPQVHPHVQSYLFVTDAVGLRILRDRRVFACHDTFQRKRFHNHAGGKWQYLLGITTK